MYYLNFAKHQVLSNVLNISVKNLYYNLYFRRRRKRRKRRKRRERKNQIVTEQKLSISVISRKISKLPLFHEILTFYGLYNQTMRRTPLLSITLFFFYLLTNTYIKFYFLLINIMLKPIQIILPIVGIVIAIHKS